MYPTPCDLSLRYVLYNFSFIERNRKTNPFWDAKQIQHFMSAIPVKKEPNTLKSLP